MNLESRHTSEFDRLMNYEAPPSQQSAPRQHNMGQQQRRRSLVRSNFKPVKSKPNTFCTCCSLCGCGGCGYVCIQPDEIMALERCGAYKGVRKQGCHVLGCDWCNRTLNIQKVTTRVQETELESITKTKDNVFVNITIAVQLEIAIDRTYEAIYKLEDPVGQIESYVADVIRGKVPRLMLDELFDTKDEIVNEVKQRLDANLEAFGYRIIQVLITDLSPDDKVRYAMNEIDAQRRMRSAAEAKGEALKILVVKSAEGDAESLFLQGQGTARQRTAIVDGLKDCIGGEDMQDPQHVQNLVLMTQYFDTLSAISNAPNTTIFMPHTVGYLAQTHQEINDGIFKDGAQPSEKKSDGSASSASKIKNI
jgi:regulator of protease activity HflC (stomatin/prohibitin superfamily)